MKASETVFYKERERLIERLKVAPIVKDCAWIRNKRDGFLALLVFTDQTSVSLAVTVLQRAYPAVIAKLAAETGMADIQQMQGLYPIIMAPYISEASAKQCEKLNLGYLDMSGNYRLFIRSLFMSEQGHPNQFKEKRTAKSIFHPASKVSSLILREIMRDVSCHWTLRALSETLQCSIGQVFKVKAYLCEQLWTEMSASGLRILDAKAIMQAWSNAYVNTSENPAILNGYTLDSLPVFEEKLREIRTKYGINCYLTGIAGGARYAPVVRYNKMHLIVYQKDVKQLLHAAGCKAVDSGANIQIHTIDSNELLHDARQINGDLVASPVQIYLDCMQLKGRGEEMADAVFTKEIQKS